MTRRMAAIIFIFVCASIAWAVLGSTIFLRTGSSNAALSGRVASTWGAPQVQGPPSASYSYKVVKLVHEVENGKKVTRSAQEKLDVPLSLNSSVLHAALDQEYRQKGLLWYSLYKVAFSGAYTFHNPSSNAQSVIFHMPFPAKQAVYDNLVLSVDGTPLATTTDSNGVSGIAQVGGGKSAVLRAGYHSQGLESWRYNLGGEVSQVKDFYLRVTTNFKGIDFPDNTLSPTERRETQAGWELTWNYLNLISGFEIALKMPQRLQPGPLAGRISYFAPVSLFFFFFLMFFLTTLRNIELHPMNYFFLACAFFAFHLLLAYLADHISIHAAFVICSAVSIFLMVTYLRLVVGMRFAAVEAGLAQLVYLVLFSYAFFFEGFTGLAVTIGSILTLFVVMQMTGRIRWAEEFAKRTAGVDPRTRFPGTSH